MTGRWIFSLWFIVICCAVPLQAAEYFVSTSGDDARDGRSQDAAFATIQKGVDTLAPGDTLTIAPGEYPEAVARDNLGDESAQTTIRAAIRGTVLLRGDIAAPTFTKVEGRRFVYVADFDAELHGSPQALLEHDTRTLLGYTPDPAEMEFIPGLFCHDAAQKKLYMSSSDMQSPIGRRYTVSVLDDSGIYLSNPRRVTIDGIAATGFYRIGAYRFAPCMWEIPWGIALDTPVGCVVRHCTTYLNASGIGLDSGRNNLVEDCVAFGNGSSYQAMSGNILNFGGRYGREASGTLIRNCLTFDGQKGIHQYGGMNGAVVLRHNIAWGNAGSNLHVKTGRTEDNRDFGLVEHSIVLGAMGAETARHNLILGDLHYHERDHAPTTNIQPSGDIDIDLNAHFADPDNLDFRLQADSTYRGASPDGTDQGPYAYTANVFYVRPEGNDEATGLSMQHAWQTLDRATKDLRPGDTLYIAPGTYASPLTVNAPGVNGDAVHIRGRGRAPVIIEGGLNVAHAAGLNVERLTFTGPVAVTDGRDITFNNCIFRSEWRASSTHDLRVTHCVFNGDPMTLEKCSGVFLRGNIFSQAIVTDDNQAIGYSDYNGYRVAGSEGDRDQHVRLLTPEDGDSVRGWGPLGRALGIHHNRRIDKPALRLVGPFVHSVTNTTANIEWWTTGPTGLRVAWGETPEMLNTERIEAHRHGTYSLTGLKPGTTYHFKLIAEALPDHDLSMTFTTAATPAQAKTFYVAPDGDDTHAGISRDQAWRTINHAADHARPGDTVLIAGGTYGEAVRLRATGETSKPITFKAMPGEKVTLDGIDRALSYAFYAAYKNHIHFDGFYFVGFNGLGNYTLPWSDAAPGGGNSGIFALYRSDHLAITRCFQDGRGGGYAAGLVRAVHCADLLIRNCVNTVTMGGMVNFFACPDLRIEHNVSIGNFIYNLVGVNEPQQKMYLVNNIFTDNSLMTKIAAPFFELGKVESLVEKNNCYYPRTPDEVKKLFFFYDPVAYNRPARTYGMETAFSEPPAITELTRMSLAEYQRRFNPDSGSFIADPEFVGAKDMSPLDKHGKPRLMSDALVGKADLDFPDLFATHPQVVARGIGLQREAFADFHFNR